MTENVSTSQLTFADYQAKRIRHWNQVAVLSENRNSWGAYYHTRLAEVYRYLVPSQRSVLELGCAEGNLLAVMNVDRAVGVDFSPEMIKRARARHSEIEFVVADAHSVQLDDVFDTIIMSDLMNDVWDVQQILERVRDFSGPHTRLIINGYSQLWAVPLRLAQGLGVAKPNLSQNWLTNEDLNNLLVLSGYEVVQRWSEFLMPVKVPLLARFYNRYLAKIWPFRHLCLSNFVIARPLEIEQNTSPEPTVSVIVPARNEAGNIRSAFERIPMMGSRTELVFVEGHSDDDTVEAIEREIAGHPTMPCRLYRQSGVGKGDAVRLGFSEAQGDILMILDADLTVPPEELVKFYEAIRSNKGEFVNGVRLVYPMEDQAMQSLNLIGNKLFGILFSWLLGQSIRDTLCGTKVLYRKDYERIAQNRSYFGDFDPFGDFDLLLGAAKQSLKIIEVPVRYRQRTYGSTNIDRWKHGWLLTRMSIFAARRIKFI
ncbi:MAG: glycosyltransferase [bacterium]